VLLPEMCISGYSLGDRLLMQGTVERSWRTLEKVLPETAGLIAVIGLPIQHNDVLYNAVAVAANGHVVGIVPKENLATGDVQYENRWFSGWPRGRVEDFESPGGQTLPMGNLLFEAAGVGRFAIEICEDGWKGIRPGSFYSLAGAHIIANPSASWFTLGKHTIRRTMVEQISREDHCAYLYTSLLGCDATRLIFDGSVFIAQDGVIAREGRRFRFDSDWEIVDHLVDIGSLEQARRGEGSWRQQVEAMQRQSYGEEPVVIGIPGDFQSSGPLPAPAPYWEVAANTHPDPSLKWLSEHGLVPDFSREDLSHLELELALTLGLREYAKKCGIGGFALALSGGRDSSMVAVLVARMFRYAQPDLDESELKALINEHFVTAYMGTDHSGTATRSAAQALAEELGAKHHDGAIQAAVETHLALFTQMTAHTLSWSDKKDDITLQNVQARLRGSLIWMLANHFRFVLLSTSNKSEAAVGYATMDGDTSGGLSPIADVPKSLVTAWLRWARDFHGIQTIDHVIATPATAELRPPEEKQTDEDDLMPFHILDQLIYHFVQLGQEPTTIFRTLWPRFSAHYEQDPAAFAAHIRKFVRLLCQSQWKRERFAIAFRVTSFDLDPKTGFRFPPVQAPFTEELEELDQLVAQMCAAP
jgi:NAD+ synthase (glutamine-hydrolysing)